MIWSNNFINNRGEADEGEWTGREVISKGKEREEKGEREGRSLDKA